MGFTIEVDEDVMEVLKSNAEPFKDKPNDVLRRLLLEPQNLPEINVPEIAEGIPTALRHILQVLLLIKKSGMSRRSATRKVADHYGIAHQSVSDQYVRQLGLLSVKDFEELLEKDMDTLRTHLKTKFSEPALKIVIDGTLLGV